ncbi:MAG: carotenoid oxygenase family protein [Myxococcota bacterium]
MPVESIREILGSARSVEHPYLQGAWTPLYEEVTARQLEVIGEVPRDLAGVYLRNTENPVHAPLGVYHPFDGDGMIHGISFEDGDVRYANRFVSTRGFEAEAKAGRALWSGLAQHPSLSERPGWGAHGGLKDSSSTDVVVHAGRVLSTFYQCGEGYRLDPYSLETLGVADWVPSHGISAHPKVDERTGELLFFNYSKEAPYMHYGVVDANDRLAHLTPIPLPGPRLPHDMAFSERYSILADLPLFWDPEALAKGVHAARFRPDLPTRFAVLPRYGGPDDIQWFEAAPTYVLHWMNAWEEGDELVLDGYFQEEPQPPPLEGYPKGMGRLMAYVDEHSFRPKLHRWRFNLATGATKEERLDDRILEFGSFNNAYAGRRTRYLYSTYTEPGWFLFKGVVKHDAHTGRSSRFDFGPHRYGSEAPFAPRVGAVDEDDGYLVSFVTDMAEDRSECVLLDARDITAGPVARILLPHRISSGTHATWASHEAIRKESPA